LPRAPPSQWAEIQSVFPETGFSGKRLEDIL
jgi:hypothetical protein